MHSYIYTYTYIALIQFIGIFTLYTQNYCLLTQGRYQMALSTIQRVIKDDVRLLVYALHNLVQVFIGMSNSDGEMAASELLHQVCITAVHIYT